MTYPQELDRLSKKDLWRVFFRAYWIRTVNSPDRMQSLGLTVAITPILEKYYTKEESSEIMNRYLNEYFLTSPMMANWIIGIVCSIEERIAASKDISRDVVASIKTALMGPLAAIGDGLYNGTLRPIVAGIACTLALTGNAFAPLLFLSIMIIANLALRISGIFVGYRQGASFFEKLQTSGLLKKIIEAADIVAYMVVGAFAVTNVRLRLAIKWMAADGKTENSLQSILDGIVPMLLPLTLTLFTWYLIEKKRISAVKLIVAYLIAGIALYYCGIIA